MLGAKPVNVANSDVVDVPVTGVVEAATELAPAQFVSDEEIE